jgi:hypothetical protein
MMAKLNKKFVAPKQPEPIEADTSNIYTLELERLLSDAKYDEKDFAILVSQRSSKLSSEQAGMILRTLAVAFCRHGAGEAPKPAKIVEPLAPKTAQDRFDESMARASAKLRRSQEQYALIEKRAMIRLTSEVTFHDLWRLGSMLGKKDDMRLVSEHTTKAQLKEAGVEIE